MTLPSAHPTPAPWMVSYSLCFQFTFNVHSNLFPFAWKCSCLPGLLLSVPQALTQNFFKLNSHSPSLYSLCWRMVLSFIQLSKPETWEFTQVIPSIAPHDHLKDLSTILSFLASSLLLSWDFLPFSPAQHLHSLKWILSLYFCISSTFLIRIFLEAKSRLPFLKPSMTSYHSLWK